MSVIPIGIISKSGVTFPGAHFLLIFKSDIMNKKKVSLEVVNPNTAGIDVGSRSHCVSIGQDSQDVKEFGVYTQDPKELIPGPEKPD